MANTNEQMAHLLAQSGNNLKDMFLANKATDCQSNPSIAILYNNILKDYEDRPQGFETTTKYRGIDIKIKRVFFHYCVYLSVPKDYIIAQEAIEAYRLQNNHPSGEIMGNEITYLQSNDTHVIIGFDFGHCNDLTIDSGIGAPLSLIIALNKNDYRVPTYQNVLREAQFAVDYIIKEERILG